MVDFRRFVLALAVLALFAGMVSAQTGGAAGGTPLTCATNVTVTPQLRGEGFTEQTGDVTLSCTGGSAIAAGQPVPLVNFTIYYNTAVTSRLLPIASSGLGASVSEALLLVDEPGSNLGGYGAMLPQVLCTTPLTGCPATVGYQVNGTAVVPGTTTPAPNVYQGVVSGNSVTFYGVPALPPTTTGTRVYRITNVRVNATPLAGGSLSGATAVYASISISPASALSISQSTLAVGFVQLGLTAGAANANTTLQQCVSAGRSSGNVITNGGLLSFGENFGTAFKTRIAPQINSLYYGQSGSPGFSPATPNQDTPGIIYNSESNFVFPIPGQTMYAGLADYGTRLMATFNNIPAGVSVYVSVNNVTNLVTPIAAPAIPGGTSIASWAQLVNGATTNDGAVGYFPAITATDTTTGGVAIAQVPITGGTGTAVWEVLNTNPNASETFSFGAYLLYTANVAQSAPLAGTSTVNLSFAPTATSGVASSSLTIPRFVSDATAARTLFAINICRTILLYPYITNQAGFDTGLTVANTSQDPFTVGSHATQTQTGSCVFTWYGGTTAAPTTPPAATNTGTILGGTVWAGLASTLIPTFQGYAFAVCNFQFAHGFAFISDLGARNLAMGYLAVVLDDPSTGSRPNHNTQNTENGGH